MFSLTKEEIKEGLKGLGLKRGDRVMVHSSLSSLGWVEGGAETVIDALIETVGKEGLLMMPSFTQRQYPFHRENAPSRSGLITETFRKRKGTFRSGHPTHAIAAFGKGAEEIVKGHRETTAFSKDSPVGRLVSQEGYILLIGVRQNNNSAIHLAEELAEVPYIYETEAPVLDDDGNVSYVHITRAPGHSNGFLKIEPILERSGIIKETTIGEARVQLMKGRDVVNLACRELKRYPAAFLCDNPDCLSCSEAREMIRKAKEDKIKVIERDPFP